jgi:DNA (cytosine-5)-methyltransferase 1
MKIGSLCTGYGGLDIAVERFFGAETVWVSDNDPKVSQWLAENLPEAPNLGDVKLVDWDSVSPIDIMTAGYPCQPFSLAGKREGVNDPRHIWPDVYRGICALRPRYVVLENVPGHRKHGFGEVLGDLAEARYDCRWISLSASHVGAPHKRERVFIVGIAADPIGELWDGSRFQRERRGAEHSNSAVSATHSPSWWWIDSDGVDYSPAVGRWEEFLGRQAPAPHVSSSRSKTGFVPSQYFYEWMMGLDEGHVTDSQIPVGAQKKILGNGVVPEQAFQALRLLFSI